MDRYGVCRWDYGWITAKLGWVEGMETVIPYKIERVCKGRVRYRIGTRVE